MPHVFDPAKANRTKPGTRHPRNADGSKRRGPTKPLSMKTVPTAKRADEVADGKQRLQKILANAGVASRRASEDLIAAGRVQVDGKTIFEAGRSFDPALVKIKVDGTLLHIKDEPIVIAVNKPVGFISAMEDPQGRPTLSDLVGEKYGRVFHIGRLDQDSQGLILMTNWGDLAQAIAHPSGEMLKTYVVNIKGKINPSTVRKLEQGIDLKDGFQAFDKIKTLDATQGESICEVVLHSGKNRIVRRMFKAAGHPVIKLVRTKIGPISLGELKEGKSRVLNPAELAALEKLAKF